MTKKYYAIYDINLQEYFTDNPFCTTNFTNMTINAKWFCSKYEAKTFIENTEKLRHKRSLCIKEVANFDD